MGNLNNRTIEVIIGKQGEKGVSIRDHRVDFNVVYTSDAGEPPKAVIKIFNPPMNLAGLLKKDGPNFISLAVGYQGNPTVVFAGRPPSTGIKMSRTNSDWILEVTANSGGEKYRSAVVSQALSGQLSFEGFVRDVIEQADLKVGTLDLEEAPDDLPRLVFEGSSFRLLERLAQIARCEVVFDGEYVHFLQANVGIPEGTEKIPSFSSRKGSLIGQPVQTDKGLTIRALMDPRMRVGKRFEIDYFDPFEAKYTKVIMIAKEVLFKGSNWTNDFYVELLGYRPKAGAVNRTEPSTTEALRLMRSQEPAKSSNVDQPAKE